MATAYFNTKTETRTEEKRVVTEVKTEVVDAVTLTLTLDEARLVRTLVGQALRGDRLRELGDAVWKALNDLGVGYFMNAFVQKPEYTKGCSFYVESENLPKPKETRENLQGWIG